MRGRLIPKKDLQKKQKSFCFLSLCHLIPPKRDGSEALVVQQMFTLMELNSDSISLLREKRHVIRSHNKIQQFPFSAQMYRIMASLAFQNNLIWEEGPSHLLDPNTIHDDM